MSEQTNGGTLPTLPSQPAQPVDRFAAEVQTGLARYYEIVQEAEALRRKFDAETLENQRLRIQLENVREHERNHVAVVVNEAKIEQHKFAIENSMLRDELEAQRRELAAERRQTEDARAEAARLTAALSLIGASIVETIGKAPDKD